MKRDDLVHPFINGNKARKLYSLIKNPPKDIDTIISFGGNQSNFLVALAYFCKYQNFQLNYYIKPLSNYLKNNPLGNYETSLSLHVNFIEIDNFEDINRAQKKSLFISQGGKNINDSEGFKALAKELEQDILKYKIENPLVFIPSGTGVSAFYLSKYLKVKVITTPCIGDEAYLKAQWKELNIANDSPPEILHTKKKYHFAKCYKEFIYIYQELKKQLEFDLLYDSKGFLSIKENKRKENIIYIHGGGINGNESMLKRYKHKLMI